MGLEREHASRTTMKVERVVQNPSEVMQQVLLENQTLKAANANLGNQLTEALQGIQDMRTEMKALAPFKQVLNNPVDKLTIELYDSEILRTVRGHMITMFGQGGQIDSEGKWVQTIVNQRLQIVLRQLLFNGLQRWHRVRPQIEEIIKVQGLMK